MRRRQSAYLQAEVVIVAILQPLEYYILRTEPVHLLENEKFQLIQGVCNFTDGCLAGKIYDHLDDTDDDDDDDDDDDNSHYQGHDRTDLIIKEDVAIERPLSDSEDDGLVLNVHVGDSAQVGLADCATVPPVATVVTIVKVVIILTVVIVLIVLTVVTVVTVVVVETIVTVGVAVTVVTVVTVVVVVRVVREVTVVTVVTVLAVLVSWSLTQNQVFLSN